MFLNNYYYNDIIDVYNEFRQGKKEMEMYEKEYDTLANKLIDDKNRIEKTKSEINNIDLDDYLGDVIEREVGVQGTDKSDRPLISKGFAQLAKAEVDDAAPAGKLIAKKKAIKKLKTLFFRNLSYIPDGKGGKDFRELLKQDKMMKIRFDDDNGNINLYDVNANTFFKTSAYRIGSEEAGTGLDRAEEKDIDVPLTLKTIYEARIDAVSESDKSTLTSYYNTVVEAYKYNMGEALTKNLTNELVEEKQRYEIDKEKLNVIKVLLDDKEKILEKSIKEKIKKAENKVYESGIEYLYDGRDVKREFISKKEKYIEGIAATTP
jgi:hypothetical protein